MLTDQEVLIGLFTRTTGAAQVTLATIIDALSARLILRGLGARAPEGPIGGPSRVTAARGRLHHASN